jgi:ABC-type lipoprotein export system ATPase subunit
LSKIYGYGENQVKALDHASFSIEKGEFVLIVGSSGSGSSSMELIPPNLPRTKYHLLETRN